MCGRAGAGGEGRSVFHFMGAAWQKDHRPLSPIILRMDASVSFSVNQGCVCGYLRDPCPCQNSDEIQAVPPSVWMGCDGVRAVALTLQPKERTPVLLCQGN